jgi:hypothetical protein
MKGLDDGPDGLNEAVFNRLLAGKRKKAKRRSVLPQIQNTGNAGPVGAPCVCSHALEEHGHDLQYPGSTACAACSDCIAYEAGDPP